MRKIWNIRQKDKEKAAALAAELGVSALLAGILLNRGIDNAAAAREFLHPEEREYYDPYLLPDMDKAVKRILDKSYAEAKAVLTENRPLLDEIAAHLLLKETISGEEMMAFINASKTDAAPEAAEPAEE